MLNKNEVYYYKDLYSGHKIIYVRFMNNEYLFRTLTRKEYKFLKFSNKNKYDLQDAICTAACVYPEGINFGVFEFAGMIPRCSNLIEYHSGFSDLSIVLDEYREFQKETTMESQCMDLIKAFIPEYTYEEMEDWTWEKLMKTTVRAERVAHLKGFADFHLEDSSEEVAEKLKDIHIKNEVFVDELIVNGIDPMMYFYDDLKNNHKKEIVDFPMILGNHWRDDEVVNIVKAQVYKRSTNSR